MQDFLIATLFSLIGKVTGAVNGALTGIIGTFKEAAKAAMFFHEKGIATAREVGMSYQQSIAYTETLTKRTAELAGAYALTREQVAELQNTIYQATSKQIFMTAEDADRMAQISRTVGTQVAGVFSSAIVNTMGGQLSTMEGAVTKAYATAAKSGLVASKFSEKVAQNLALANKFNFRDGVDSIIRMTAMSEKLGYNLSTMASAADKFNNFESAIETSARLNMLGGSAGLYGSNPLQLMYESMYDQEKFNESMVNMLKSYGRYDEKKGMGVVDSINMDFIREISNAMGISMDEAVSIAKNSATIRKKESIAGSALNRIAGNDQMLRDFILNKAQISQDGSGMYITGENGEKYTLSQLMSGKGKEWLDKTYANSQKSDSEIMRESAEKLITVNERIAGWMEKLYDTVGRYIGPLLVRFKNWMEKDGKEFIDNTAIPALKKLLDFLSGKANDVISTVLAHPIATAIGLGITSVLGGAFKIWIGAVANKAIGGLFKGSATTKGFGKTVGMPKGSWGNVKNLWAWMSNSKDAAAVAKGAKVAKGIGAGVGLGLGGLALNYGTDYAVKSGLIEEDSMASRYGHRTGTALEWAGVGAAVGSIIPGVGTAIGAAIGGAGGYIGEYVKEYLEYHDKSGGTWYEDLLGFMERDVRDFYNELIVKPINKIKEWWGYGAALLNGVFTKNFWVNTANFISKKFKSFIDTIDDAFGGILSKAGFINRDKGSERESASKVWADAGLSVLSNVPVMGSFFSALKGIGVSGFFSDKKAGKFATGGVVPGNQTEGDKLYARVNSGEGIFNKMQMAKINSALDTFDNVTSIVAKPIGGKEYIYTPGGSRGSGGSNNFNINISGEIRLTGNGGSTTINARELLNDYAFVKSLKDMIKESISRDIQGGRVMNDISMMRGMPSNQSVFGK